MDDKCASLYDIFWAFWFYSKDVENSMRFQAEKKPFWTPPLHRYPLVMTFAQLTRVKKKRLDSFRLSIIKLDLSVVWLWSSGPIFFGTFKCVWRLLSTQKVFRLNFFFFFFKKFLLMFQTGKLTQLSQTDPREKVYDSTFLRMGETKYFRLLSTDQFSYFMDPILTV